MISLTVRTAEQKCFTTAAFLFHDVFVFMWSNRRGAIFGACCSGCFYHTHPSGLVFKPWPSGSKMMRTVFQSPSPLKAWQSSIWTQKTVSIFHHVPPYSNHVKLKLDFFFRRLKPYICFVPSFSNNLYPEKNI